MDFRKSLSQKSFGQTLMKLGMSESWWPRLSDAPIFIKFDENHSLWLFSALPAGGQGVFSALSAGCPSECVMQDNVKSLSTGVNSGLYGGGIQHSFMLFSTHSCYSAHRSDSL